MKSFYEYIHDCLFQLDAGVITEKQFAEKIALACVGQAPGIEMPKSEHAKETAE